MTTSTGFDERGRGGGGDGDAPGGVLCADDFAEVAPRLRRVFVNGADDFKRGFVAHQADDRSADGTYAELHHTNLLSHRTILGREIAL